MALFYVNKNPQENGDHEVHEYGCTHAPNSENAEYLGNFSSCREAVKEARKKYPTADGCYYCAPACHKQ